MVDLVPGAVYLIELCSGEQRHWRFCGAISHAPARWQDMETQHEFSEASLLYAWKILRRLDESSHAAVSGKTRIPR